MLTGIQPSRPLLINKQSTNLASQPITYHFAIRATSTKIHIKSRPIDSVKSYNIARYCILFLLQRTHDIPLPGINKTLQMTSKTDMSAPALRSFDHGSLSGAYMSHLARRKHALRKRNKL